ncbi:MAG: glycoside hydrolase family 9 protein [Lachnospiraceae bacterium]|nr:glycoside hydrolase family 9 protein [Lachnospiraceae bacterium]
MQKIFQTRGKNLLFCLICVTFLSGCHMMPNSVTEPDDVAESATDSDVQSDYEVEMEQREGFIGEEEYEQNFTRPQVNSNIYVDLLGYTPDDQKLAYFVGEELSDTFYIYDSATDKRIFSGPLKKMGNEKVDGKNVYRGDFSEITEPGVYYIQTAIIGQSYTFRIDEGRYENQHDELKKEFLALTPGKYYGKTDTCAKRMQIYYSFQKLATAYQFFGQSFDDDYGKKLEEHLQWMLELRQEVLADRAKQEKPDYNEPGAAEEQVVKEDYMFASAMATAYTVVQPHNASLAGQSLIQAQKAYQNALRFKMTGDHQYMAAAALFRASGNYSYHGLIKEAYSGKETLAQANGYKVLSGDKDVLCDYILWGNLFYMTSTKGADLNICDVQMSQMMDLCGEYLNGSPKKAFGLIDEREISLEKSIWLTMSDYIIVSREYRNVCKEQLHALVHDMEEIYLSHEQKTTLLLVLANLTESEETE